MTRASRGQGRRAAVAAMAALPMLLAACGDAAPSGQVVATVAGEDVTRRDLAAEAYADGSAGTATDPPTRLLARVVDRKLLASAARADGLDRTPDYLAAIRRGREDVLAALLSASIAAELPPASAGQVAAFRRDHPWMFARRQTYRTRTIDVDVGPALAGVPRSGEALVALLGRAGRRFHDAAGPVDGAALSRDDAARLASAPLGQPFVVPATGLRYVVVTARTATPLDGAAADGAARQELHRRLVEQAVRARIERARAGAAIRYRAGFGPER